MKALEIIQQVSLKLGFDKPATIEDDSDGTTQRLLGQLNSILRELVLDYDWQKLKTQCTFTTGENVTIVDGKKGYNINTLTNKQFNGFITPYLYNMTTRSRIDEITLDRYELDQFYTSSPYSRFIFMKNMIIFSTDLPNGQNISFFYKSKYPIYYSSTDESNVQVTNAKYFSKDLEESYIDSTLLMLGTIWKYKDEVGLDYAESFQTYEKYLNKLKDQDSMRGMVGGYKRHDMYPFGVLG